MLTSGWTPAQRWIYALKPASWPKLLVPVVLGLVIGGLSARAASFGPILLVLVFTLADAVFIVLLNDVADEPVDRLKRRMFPEAGSPKTLVDGVLDRQTLMIGATVAGTYALVSSIAGAIVLGRVALVPAAMVALALFAGYSLPPVRMNYRGGGEALEALGVGIVLPWFAAHAMSGEVFPDGLVLLPGLGALALASAVASGLSDEDSDRRGGKRTVVSSLGNSVGRRVTEGALALGVVLWLGAIFKGAEQAPWPPVVVASCVVAGHIVHIRKSSDQAVSRAFAALAHYKAGVNEAVRDGTLVLAVGLLVERFVQSG